MKKRIVVVSLLLIISIVILITTKENINDQQTVISENQRQKTAYLPDKAYVKGFNPTDPYFNDKVINDVKRSFKNELKLLYDNDEAIAYTLKDLQNAQIAVGKKDSHLESLISKTKISLKSLDVVQRNGKSSKSLKDNNKGASI